jgi:hypothetical protein
MSDEQTKWDELSEHAERGRVIRILVNQPGWKEILEPMLKNNQANLLNQFLTTKFSSLSEVLLVQQSINAIDSIFKTIEFLIVQGDNASEQLKDKPL